MSAVPGGGGYPPARARRALFPAALAIPAPGERTISNAEVPLPRSPPLLGCRHCSEKRSSAGFALNRRLPCAGCQHGKDCKCRAPSSPGDARGEAPCIRKLKISPFPGGEGGRGDGGRIKTKGGGGKRQGKHTPPPGTTAAGRTANAGNKPPAGRVVCLPVPVPPGFSPRGCKGRSPLHKKAKNLPLPAGKGGGGVGGWGQESKLKARLVGDCPPLRPPPGTANVSC